MSGTSIVHLFHCIFHVPSTVMSATGQAEVVRSMDDSQGHALSTVGGSDGTNPDRNKSRRKQMDRWKIVLLRMSIPWVAEVLAAYTV